MFCERRAILAIHFWGDTLLFILIVLNIIIVFVIFSILSYIKKISSEIEFFQNSFFKTKKELFGLLEFMPLYGIARDLYRQEQIESDEFDIALRRWGKIELKELENFAAIKPDENAAFVPSDDLKNALRDWSLCCYKIGLINDWKALYQTVYCDLMGGKINLEDAEKKLKTVSPFSLTLTVVSPEAEDIYNDWAKNWNTPEWKKRLDFIREQNKYE